MKQRPLQFSYWPMYRGTRRYGLQAHVYATSPWALIRAAIREDCWHGSQPEAFASVDQAEFFYSSAVTSGPWAAKPLLLYYSFLNIAKAYALTKRVRQTYDRAKHGMSEQLGTGGKEIVDAFLACYPSAGGTVNVFDHFWRALTGTGIGTARNYDLTALLPQIVAGHRLWCNATDRRERFIGIQRIDIMHNVTSQRLWLVLRVHGDDLTRLGLTHARLLTEARLQASFREVQPDTSGERKVLRLEQRNTIGYTDRPSDEIPTLVAHFRHNLWATVASTPPYRRYYLYLAPATEAAQVLPQLMSIYGVVYYLSSVARYRPQQFGSIVNGQYGQQIQEILSSQPSQFVYLLASEFARRDVTRPAIV